MITTNGKLHIKRYMAGFVPAIAQSIAFGIGARAAAVGDTAMNFEVVRADILLTSLDLANNKIIYKAALPAELGGTIYETAIFSAPSDTVAGEFSSRLIVSFDSESETWADPSTGAAPTYSAAASRLGVDSLHHAPAASGSETDALTELDLDLGGYSGADKFVFAYNVGNANTSSIRFRFMTDASNYYDITLGAQAVGYKITEIAKSSATVTGSPDWSNITQIQVTTTSGAGGSSSVYYDGIRVEDVDTINPNYVMVSREVLGTPIAKTVGKVLEVEYALDITV